MSGANLPAVDRVVKIVRELDRYHGLGGGAQGTEKRRKLLESLDSGAETDPSPVADDDWSDPLADILPDPAACLDELLSQGQDARGSNSQGFAAFGKFPHHHVLHGPPPPRGDAGEERRRRFLAVQRQRNGGGGHPKGGGGGAPRDGLGITHGTAMRRNSLESLASGAGTAPNPAPVAGGAWNGEAWSGDAAEADADLISKLERAPRRPCSARTESGRARNRNAPQPSGKPRFRCRYGVIASLFARHRERSAVIQGPRGRLRL